MGELRRLRCEAEDAGERLDRVLARRLPDLSRARCQRLVAEGRVRVDGAVVRRPSRPLSEGARIEVEVPEPTVPEASPEPQDLGLPILYQDAAIVVVDKPAGMAVHPAPGTPDGTVVNALLHQIEDLRGIGGELRPGIVHRLDKDTTGLLVVAKSDAALRRLQALFKARHVEKRYLAIALGRFEEGSGVVATALARHPRDRKRFTGRGTEGRTGAREARTEWRVLERFAGAALLEVHPHTGRTHQIRVHLSESGHPLLGETLYRRRGRLSGVLAEAEARLGHHALHAWRLAFEHPESGAPVSFEAPPPPEWEAALACLRTPV